MLHSMTTGATPPEAGAPLTDTSDMYGVHAVFREALDQAPALLTRAAADSERTGAVAGYYAVVLRLLAAHHEGEDELLTPLLLQRCTGAELAAVTRIAAQHGPVSGALDEAESRLAAWRVDPNSASAEQLRVGLGEVQQALLPHLDEEEQVVLPIAARHVTAEEWGRLPGHALRRFDGDELWLVLGLVFDHMSHEQLAVAQAHMPPPLLTGWTEHGRASYQAVVTRLKG